jgi:hypothetical protein
MSQDLVVIPVVVNFESDKVIGTLQIKKDSLPLMPDFVFSIGYKTKHNGFELVCASILSDDQYIDYLRSKQ